MLHTSIKTTHDYVCMSRTYEIQISVSYDWEFIYSILLSKRLKLIRISELDVHINSLKLNIYTTSESFIEIFKSKNI